MADEEEDIVGSPGSPDQDDENSDDELLTGENGQRKAPPRKGKARQNYLASHKVIEKRRRDRINQALTTLGRIVPDSVQIGPSKKLDKALTLENTIAYIERIQQSGMAGFMRPGPSVQNTIAQLSMWIHEHAKNCHSTEQFIQELMAKMTAMVEEEGETSRAIKRENEAAQFAAPSVLVGVGHTGMVNPVLNVTGGQRYDPRGPSLLPVVPPAQNPMGPAAMFPQLRPPSADSMNAMEWSQKQLLFSQSIQLQHQTQLAGWATHSPAPMPMAQAYVPTCAPMQTHSPFVTQVATAAEHACQSAENSNGAAIKRSWHQDAPAVRNQVTFSASMAASGGDSGSEGGQNRPKRLNLGPSIQNNAITPGAFSTVSTPRGAATPGADDVLDLQSPGAVKQFPFNSTPMTPSRSYRQKSAPLPPTLSIEAANALPPPPDFDTRAAAAITPQRQILANSLLELSGQTMGSFNSQGSDLLSGPTGQETASMLSPTGQPLGDAIAPLQGNDMEMNVPGFRAQLMQQFSPSLHGNLPTSMQAGAQPGYSAGVTATVEPETPVGMPMLTTDQRSIPLSQHMDPTSQATVNGEETEWGVALSQPGHQDDDSSHMPDRPLAEGGTDPASSLLLLSRQHDMAAGVTSPPR